MEALESSVRLVVKAPNQQVEDQEVECALNWTVKKLKGHLSEAYPSKPRTEDQKLIYSGQLLHDHLTLKDFLRQYDTEKVHTVHLVCIPSKDFYSSKSAPTCPSQGGAASTRSEMVVGSSNDPVSRNIRFTDGVRQRIGPTAPAPQFDRVSHPAHSPVMPSTVSYPPMIDHWAQQAAWMHSMYGQYMNYYFQQVQASQQQTFQATEIPSSALNEAMPAAQPVPVPVNLRPEQAPPINQNIRMDAQGGPVDDDDDDDDVPGNWDWLDWMYVFSRAVVLFSIVYFYSSLSRFVMVSLVGIFMYLYQMGWLNARRRRRRHPAHHQGAARHPENVPEPQAENRVEENVETEQAQREMREIEDMMNEGMDNNQQDRMTTLASVVWTFVTTFFSSLLPETPAPLNLN